MQISKRTLVVAGVILAVLLAAAVYGLHSWSVAVQSAQVKEALYNQSKADFLNEKAAHEAERQAATRRQHEIEAEAQKREAVAQKRIKSVLSVKPPEAVAKDFKAEFKYAPEYDGKSFKFSPQSVQSFTAMRIERDALKADTVDLKEVLRLERVKTTSLTSDLSKSEALRVKCEGVTQAYKVASMKSKTRRVLGTVGKVAVLGGTAYVSYRLGVRIGEKK